MARPARLDPRIGLTYHLPDPAPDVPRDARMRLLHDGYVGIAPVAGGRINIGIVLGRSWRASPRPRRGPIRRRRDRRRDPADRRGSGWLAPAAADRRAGRRLAARSPRDPSGRTALAARRRRRRLPRSVHRRGHPSRPRVGRAGGGARSAPPVAAGPAPSPPTSARCTVGSSPRTRCRGSSRRSSARPSLFEYAARRIAARPAVRATMGLIMGDLVPAGRALDPRYLAALLAP